MKFVHAIEGLSLWVGRAFGWCILILTLSVSYEVFVRYVLNAPTVWAFDMMIQMYGALFLMCGAYALAQDTHVRADVVYRLLPTKVQAGLDFVLYFLFFFPGVLALVWFGYEIAADSWRYKEVSFNSPASIARNQIGPITPSWAPRNSPILARLGKCSQISKPGELV